MLSQLYALLVIYQTWILLLCALGIGWYVIQFFRSQRLLGRTHFHLERERATAFRNQAFVWLLLFVIVSWAVIYVNREIGPTLPPELLRPATRTPQFASADLATWTPHPNQTTRAQFPTATPVIAPTATLRDPDNFNITFEQPTPTPIRRLEVEPLVDGCNEFARIERPKSGETIYGGISIFGRAQGINFAGYRLELRGPTEEADWRPIAASSPDQPVDNGYLGGSELIDWEEGIYQLRLTVSDANGGDIATCQIQIGVLP